MEQLWAGCCGGMLWQGALAGCSGGVLWRGALAGCSGGVLWQDALAGCLLQEASKRPGRGQQEASKRPARSQQEAKLGIKGRAPQELQSRRLNGLECSDAATYHATRRVSFTEQAPGNAYRHRLPDRARTP